MNIDLRPFLVVWGALAVVVMVLIAYRVSVARREDDTLHVEPGVAVAQTAVAHRLEVIDRWGKTLTVITVVSGILIASAYVYQTFVGRTYAGA